MATNENITRENIRILKNAYGQREYDGLKIVNVVNAYNAAATGGVSITILGIKDFRLTDILVSGAGLIKFEVKQGGSLVQVFEFNITASLEHRFETPYALVSTADKPEIVITACDTSGSKTTLNISGFYIK